MKYFIILTIITVALVKCQWDSQEYGTIVDNDLKAKLLWGTYKPNLYFAMKNRRNVSDVFGMMWYDPTISSTSFENKLRHECKMEDELNYRWEIHNGVDYGTQSIEDKINKLKLQTTFNKNNYTTSEQNWDVHIKGEVSNSKKTSILLYFSMEMFELLDKSHFKVADNIVDWIEDGVMFHARENDKEKYFYSIRLGENTNIVDKSYQRYRKKYTDTWRVKKFINEELGVRESELKINNNTEKIAKFEPNLKIKQPNIIVIQLVFEGDFEIFVNFSNIEGPIKLSSNILKAINLKRDLFEVKFDKKFSLLNLPPNIKDKVLLKKMCMQALSNTLGGIGYFYGPIKINLDGEKTKDGYYRGFRYAVEPKGLFTGTPSRSYFARGFLWDEGFHNIIISEWDMDISVNILDTWLSTMSATGWMAREQIRGPESESQVPEKFITQDKLIANPPTLLFPIENILNHFKFYSEDNNLKNISNFLKKCYDKIGSWYEWFEIYQKSNDQSSLQWQGRTTDHNLASGLDDLPRGMTPNIYERHLDLYVWLMEMTKTLRNLSELFNYEMVSYFDKKLNRMREELRKYHYDEKTGLYSDYLGPQFKLIHNDKLKRKVPPYLWRGDGKCGKDSPNPLGQASDCNPYSDLPCCSEFGWCGNSDGHCKCPKCKVSKKLEDRNDFKDKENIFSPHVGYINLFPLAFGILETNDPAYKNTLKLLNSEEELYSEFGIRSLSKNDLLYHTGEDYWRGHIWINLNYLVLRGLYKFYKHDQKAFDTYSRLRENIINTIFNSWKTDYFFYEQYSDVDGKGRKARPFNGWTSLILSIISEKYHE